MMLVEDGRVVDSVRPHLDAGSGMSVSGVGIGLRGCKVLSSSGVPERCGGVAMNSPAGIGRHSVSDSWYRIATVAACASVVHSRLPILAY